VAQLHLLAAGAPLRATARPGETVLDVVNRLGLPLGQSCRGEGVCRSCRIFLIRGHEHLTPLTELERRDRSLDHEAGWRLACQLSPVTKADWQHGAAAEHPVDPGDPDDTDDTIVLWNPAWGHSRA